MIIIEIHTLLAVKTYAKQNSTAQQEGKLVLAQVVSDGFRILLIALTIDFFAMNCVFICKYKIGFITMFLGACVCVFINWAYRYLVMEIEQLFRLTKRIPIKV